MISPYPWMVIWALETRSGDSGRGWLGHGQTHEVIVDLPRGPGVERPGGGVAHYHGGIFDFWIFFFLVRVSRMSWTMFSCSSERTTGVQDEGSRRIGIVVTVWGTLHYHTRQQEPEVCIPGHHFQILGTNHRGPAGRDKMLSRRAPESRLFCGGTDGLNQSSTTPRNPFCVVSRASQQVFWVRAAQPPWGVRPPRTEARPGRFNRAAGAGSRCGPDLGPAASRPPTK